MGNDNRWPRLTVIEKTGGASNKVTARQVQGSNNSERPEGAHQHSGACPTCGNRHSTNPAREANWMFFSQYRAVGRVGPGVISGLLYYPEAANEDGFPI